MQLNEVINKFLTKPSCYKCKKSTAENLLLGDKNNPNSVFVQNLGEDFYSQEIDAEVFAFAVKEAVKAYTSSKDSAINIFKNLIAYAEEEMHCHIPIEFPPIPVSNTFERLMFIAKYFHDPENTVEGLQDILWVSSRTIEDDLAKLRGMDEDPIQICGRKFEIGDTRRSGGHLEFASTAHPFFLTANLTQVIAMLKGLEEMGKRPEWRGYTDMISRQIWQQLSDYGKKRVRYVLTELMPEEIGWLEALDQDFHKTFYGEGYCSTIGDDALMMSMKNNMPVTVEYQTENGSQFFKNVKFLNWEEDGYRVDIDGQERILERDKIIRSSVNDENMF